MKTKDNTRGDYHAGLIEINAPNVRALQDWHRRTFGKPLPNKIKRHVEASEGATRAAQRMLAIEAEPIVAADISTADDAGRRLLMRLRREYNAPVARFSRVRGGEYQRKLSTNELAVRRALRGATWYERPRNIWDDVREWYYRIMEELERGGVDVERCVCKAGGVEWFNEWFRIIGATKATVERYIAALVDFHNTPKQSGGGE